MPQDCGAEQGDADSPVVCSLARITEQQDANQTNSAADPQLSAHEWKVNEVGPLASVNTAVRGNVTIGVVVDPAAVSQASSCSERVQLSGITGRVAPFFVKKKLPLSRVCRGQHGASRDLANQEKVNKRTLTLPGQHTSELSLQPNHRFST